MGYLGMVGGANPCAFTPEYTPNVQQVIAFRDSPFGIGHDFGSPPTFTPYEVDPDTLDYEIRPDLAVTGLSGMIWPEIVLNDTTMMISKSTALGGFPSTWQHEVFVLTRSGITIALSGAQATVSPSGSIGHVAFIDETHFIRAYTSNVVPFDRIVETYSVSGSTVSLVSTNAIAAGATVTKDPGPGTETVNNEFFPFHHDSSTGTLYVFGSAGASRRIFACPYSPGGGITFPAGCRSKDASGIQAAQIRASKPGTSECVIFTTTGGSRAFYDDGSNMHIATTGVLFSHILYPNSSPQTPQDNYLAATGSVQIPAGGPTQGPGIITQSGLSLSFSPITPIFRCLYIDGVFYGYAIGGTRHGPGNLGCQIVGDGFGSAFLRVYRW